jgi:tetratricopeptide (TPR) repeat protein
MADVQATEGKPEAALASYNKSLVLLREIGMKTDIANTLSNMGSVYQDVGKFDHALDVFKQGLEIERETGDQQYEALSLNNIANVYQAIGDNDNAFTYYQQALQLREKLGVPVDIADTLEGLSEAYTATGQYEQAMTGLMRALELARNAGDEHITAVISHQIGLVFEYQGRFGAAVKSMQDAVKSFRRQGETGVDMAQFLNGLSGALARAGKSDEAAAPLEESQKIQQALKNDALQAEILITRGDLAFYRGDIQSAAPFYESALRLASKTKYSEVLLQSKVNLAKIAVSRGQFAEALRALRPLLDANGAVVAAHVALQINLALAQAEIGVKDYARANHDLQQELPRAQRAGVRFGLARIYYLLGTSARLSGSTGMAADYYRESAQLLDVIRGDPGAEKIMRRTDFKIMYDESNRWKK